MKGWEQVTVGKGLMARSTLYEAYSQLTTGGWVRVTDKLIRAAVPGQPDPAQEGEGLL